MPTPLCLRSLCLVLLAALLPAAPVARAAMPTTAPATAPASAAEQPRAYLLHLPGIGGHLAIDDTLIAGLRQGGIVAEAQIYDWTCGDPGLNALFARRRNEEQAGMVAELIAQRAEAGLDVPIILTGHSGGAGIAVWALERLPEGVMIETLVLLAPALSPNYDLTEALRHVRGKAFVLSSPYDPILGLGTRTFGTIDGVKTDAAGRVGFLTPGGADPLQYAKLVPMPYDSAWLRFRNIGDHVGPMMRPFAREILAPVLLGSRGVPAVVPGTPPAATQATR